jgi:hypothetical protein
MVRRCHFHARPNANLWMEFRRHGHARLANEVAKLVARVPREMGLLKVCSGRYNRRPGTSERL